MQKALTEMNLTLHTVLTDLTGQTGLKIVRSILDGERYPERLAAHRNYRCDASHAEILAALTGNYRAEHLFALRQNFAAYEFLLQQIAECDGEIEALPTTLATQQPPPSAALPAEPRKRVSKHQPQFDIRGPPHRLTGGTDLSQIDSIGPQTALQLIAEIGTDTSRWPSEYHFASWTTLAPNNRISGGRLLSFRTPPSANRVAAIVAELAGRPRNSGDAQFVKGLVNSGTSGSPELSQRFDDSASVFGRRLVDCILPIVRWERTSKVLNDWGRCNDRSHRHRCRERRPFGGLL